VVDLAAAADSRTRRSVIPQYIALAFILAAVLVYEIRYAAYRYPNWFRANAVDYSFLVLPKPDQPQFFAYVFPEKPVPGVRYRDVVLRINGVSVTGSAVFGEAFRRALPGDILRVDLQSANGREHTATVKVARAVRPNPFTGLSGSFDFLFFIVLPAFSLALGFWVTAVCPHDRRAWLLLAFLLSSRRSPIPVWNFGALDCATMVRLTKA
jgi:hypothetical protein